MFPWVCAEWSRTLIFPQDIPVYPSFRLFTGSYVLCPYCGHIMDHPALQVECLVLSCLCLSSLDSAQFIDLTSGHRPALCHQATFLPFRLLLAHPTAIRSFLSALCSWLSCHSDFCFCIIFQQPIGSLNSKILLIWSMFFFWEALVIEFCLLA